MQPFAAIMKMGVCRHTMATALMTVVIPLLLSMGLPCKVNSTKPGDPRSAIHIDCGTSEDSLINVTFTGEAFSVHSVENELGCTAERINVAKFRFVGINKQPCGVKWIDKMKTLVIKLHVQKNVIVMREDILYNIECIYGKTVQGQLAVDVTDGRSQIAADEMAPGDTGLDDEPSSIPGEDYFTLKILDQRMLSPNVFQSTDEIKVQIEMKNPSADVDVVVTECLFSDSSNKKLFQRKFLYHGCGDGMLLKKSQKFNVVKKGYKIQSPKLPVRLLQGQGPVLIKCFISACIPSTACVVTCPSDSNIEDAIADNVEGRFVISSELKVVNVSQGKLCNPELIPSLPSTTTVLPVEKPAPVITTKVTTTTATTKTGTTKTGTTTTEPAVTAVPLKYVSDFNNPEFLPYVIVVFILSFSVGILILVVIFMSMKMKNKHKKGSSRFPRSYSTYQSSKHPSKSNLLHTVFLTPTSSESGSGSGDETRYNGNNYMKRHPVTRLDSFERRRSRIEKTRAHIPKISRSGSDIRERVHTFPEESYPRRTKSEPNRPRSNIHERDFSPTRFGDLDRRCNSIPRAHYTRQPVQEAANRRDSSSMQRWEGEPRPDYRRTDSYKKGWEVMEPILEELQSSDLHIRGHHTKL